MASPHAGGDVVLDDGSGARLRTAPDASRAQSGASGAQAGATAARPIVVGISESIDPTHAPVPHTAAERLVFAQLYQPLVRRTCDGRVEPLLAARWREAHDGRLWTFTLRKDVRAWDGEPITAADVVASWRTARETGWITAVAAVDARTVRIEVAEPVDAAFFASPELAVWRRAADSAWPVGSGPYRPVEAGTSGPHRPLAVETQEPGRAAPGGRNGEVSLAPRAGGPHLHFRTSGDDARDALDAGADLIVTSDPTVLDYAADAPDLLTIPLAWDRTYFLVGAAAHARPEADGGQADADGRPWRLVRPPETALAALARDAVRTDARPAVDPPTDLDACMPETQATASSDGRTRRSSPGKARPSAPASGSRRIVYPTGDAAARALAERIVALALDPSRPDASWLPDALPALSHASARPTAPATPPTERRVMADAPRARVFAEALPARAFTEALRRGDDVAYVVPVERRAASAPSDALAAVRDHAPWLDAAGAGPERATVVPLIETRKTLIVRRGVGGVAVDGDGTLLLEAVRRATAAGGTVPASPSADRATP